MAWTVTGQVPDAAGVPKLMAQVAEGDAKASQAQLLQASRCARMLIDQGQLGRGPYTVTLSGYGNPEHKREEPGKPDTVSVTVSAASLEPKGEEGKPEEVRR